MTDSRTDISFFKSITEALRGIPHDYTSGSLYRAVIVLSVPMVLEMLMQSVFEVVDIYFVGRISADAVAAVGLTASMIILIFAVGLGISLAATAMVARRIGENDPDSAARVTGQATIASIACSIPVGFLAVLFSGDLLSMMGGTSTVIELGRGYTAILIGGNITILLLFLFNAVFRGAGDPGLAMRALWLANILNIILDPMFIFGFGPIPEMGVTGAAIATTIGRAIGVMYQVWMLSTGKSRVRLRISHLRLDRELMRPLLRVSGPGMVQYLIGTASWLALMRIMAMFGSASLAGYTIAIRIIVFALLPAWGMANAAATMVGQNLGALQPGRAEKAVWICSGIAAVSLAVLGALVWVDASLIVSFFSEDPEVIRVGVRCLRIVTLFYPVWALGMVTVQAFNGAGDTMTPTWINLVSFWVIQIPLAWIFAASMSLGEDGIFWAIALAQTTMAVMAGVLFKRGTWKETHV